MLAPEMMRRTARRELPSAFAGLIAPLIGICQHRIFAGAVLFACAACIWSGNGGRKSPCEWFASL